MKRKTFIFDCAHNVTKTILGKYSLHQVINAQRLTKEVEDKRQCQFDDEEQPAEPMDPLPWPVDASAATLFHFAAIFCSCSSTNSKYVGLSMQSSI